MRALFDQKAERQRGEKRIAVSDEVSRSNAYCRAFRWRSLRVEDVVSWGQHQAKTGGKPAIVCDVILPMSQLPAKCVPEVLEGEAHSKSLRYVRDNPISEKYPRFRLGAVTNGENLECRPK